MVGVGSPNHMHVPNLQVWHSPPPMPEQREYAKPPEALGDGDRPSLVRASSLHEFAADQGNFSPNAMEQWRIQLQNEKELLTGPPVD